MTDYKFVTIALLLVIIIGILVYYNEQPLPDTQGNIVFSCGTNNFD